MSRKAGSRLGIAAANTGDNFDADKPYGSNTRFKRGALVVLGMHRSGTSALTGLLHRLGAKAPKTPLAAAPDNPKGFSESARLLEVHNRLLASAGSNWLDWTPFNSDWVRSPTAGPFLTDLGQAFDQEYGDAPFLAIKDPRICRFASLWFDLLDERQIQPLPIIAFRNPLEVAASLEARGGTPLMHGMLLWLRHVLDAEHATRGMARAFVDHRKVLDDWRTVASDLRERLDVHWPRFSPSVQSEIDAWIDRSLRHQVATEKAVLTRGNIADWVRVTYVRLLELSEQGETPAALKALDGIRTEFDRASQVFGPFCHQYEAKANWSSAERQKAVAAQQASEAAAKAMEVRAAELQGSAASANERLTRSEQQAAKLTQELAAAKTSSEATVKALEARVTELTTSAAGAAERLTQSEQKAAKLAQELATAKTSSEATVKSLEARLAEQESARTAAIEGLAKSEQQAARLAQELATAKASSEATVKSLEARVTELTRSAAGAAERLTQSEQKAAQLAQELATAKTSSEATVKSLEARVTELSRSAAGAAERLTQSEQKSATLAQELATAKASSEAKVKSLEARLVEQESARTKAIEGFAKSEQQVAKLVQDLATAKALSEATCKTLEARVTELQGSAERMTERLAISELTNAKLGQDLAAANAAAEAMATSHDARIADLQTQAAAEAGRATKSEQHAAKLARDLAEAKASSETKTKSLESQLAEFKTAANESAAHLSRFEALSRVHLASEERIARLTAELATIRKDGSAGGAARGSTDAKVASREPGKLVLSSGQSQAGMAVADSAQQAGSSVHSGVSQSRKTDGPLDMPPLDSLGDKKHLQPAAKANGSAGAAPHVLNGKHGATAGRQANGAAPPLSSEGRDKLADVEAARPLFDREFYLRRYPDIARALERGTLKGNDPLLHYIEFGGREKRDPNPWFSSEFYLSTHVDVAKSGLNPLVHFVTAGRSEGRAYSAFSSGAPLFDAFSHVLGMPPSQAEKLLSERRSDLRKRLETGELGRMVERASNLEPLVRHSTLAAIRAGITPFRNEGLTAQIVAMHRMQAAADWKRAKAVVLIPWVHLSGATRIAGHLCHALADVYGAEEVVVIRTETSEFQFPDWFPAGCRHIDFAGEAERVRPESRMRLLVEYLRSLCPAAIFNVNSRLLWEAMEPYGKALADSAALYAYLFCNDKNIHGDWVGYPVRNFHRYFDDFTAVITDSRYLATSLHHQFQLPPSQVAKLVTLDTPADAGVPIAQRLPVKPGGRPQVFWAGRFDRQKRVDIAYEIARRMPDVDFRMWGEAVLDKSAGRMKTPGNVRHEGVYQAFNDLPLGECDAWLYTSEWDGVPNMLIEVAAAAIPLVGSLAGGTSDILAADLSHPIADIENVDGYVGAIRDILGNPRVARERALKLREKIYRERNTSVYLDAVRQILPKEA